MANIYIACCNRACTTLERRCSKIRRLVLLISRGGLVLFGEKIIMTAISATTAGMRDMADGTLRISFDIEPRHAQEAYALFGARGSSVAIAALNLQASTAMAQQETIEADKPKGGFLSQWLALRCKEPKFWAFVQEKGYGAITDENDCDATVKLFLGIESKTELDNDPQAEQRFHKMIRLPYSQWLAGVR